MQQTKTYKLNLIETSDTFSPDPLNENTEKLEAEVSAEAAARSVRRRRTGGPRHRPGGPEVCRRDLQGQRHR